MTTESGPPREKRICAREGCGVVFTVYPGQRGDGRRYHSEACRRAAHAKRRRDVARAERERAEHVAYLGLDNNPEIMRRILGAD